MSLTAEQVRAASAAWVWFPATASFDETDTDLLVRYPPWFDHSLEVARFDPTGDLGAAVDATLDRARSTGEPEVFWWVRLGGRDGVEQLLVARGAELDETLDVLARDLSVDLPEPGPADVELRRCVDAATMSDSRSVIASAFDAAMPPDDQIEADAAIGAQTWGRGEGGGLVAYLDGVAVGTGGVSVVDGVGRLWSGSVVESARGRGVYRSLLAGRLAFAREQGADLGLVKGRVQTSGPILRRAGFRAFGQERGYRVPLR